MSGIVTAEETESEKRMSLRKLIYHRGYRIRPRTDKKREVKISIVNWTTNNCPVRKTFFPPQLSCVNENRKELSIITSCMQHKLKSPMRRSQNSHPSRFP